MRRQDRQENQNQRDNNRFNSGSGRNNDWNRTSEHFSSDRQSSDRDRDRLSQATEYDLSRNSRMDEYDRYGYNRNNENDFQNTRYRESDSWDSPRSTPNRSSFYNNNAGNYGMSSSQNGARNFDNNRYGNSSYENYSNNSFAQNDFRHSDMSNDRSGHYGKGPKGWKRSDERIKDEVCEVLYRDQHIDATNIDVSVKDGTVTLSGSIDSRQAKRHAEECVEHLSGVDDVQNEIKVSRNETTSSVKEPLRKLS